MKHPDANTERRAAIRFVRRQLKRSRRHSIGWLDAYTDMEQWLLGRVKRFRKRKGGL